MKSYCLVALLIAFTLPVAANAQTTTFHGKGSFAQSNFTAGSTQVSLFVGQGDVSVDGNPFISYSTFSSNPDGSFTYGFGSGDLPAGAFAGDTLQHMSVNVDTSQIPGFQATTCTVAAAPTFTTTCTNGPFGVIQLTWQQNGGQSTTNSEEANTTTGPFITHVVQNSTQYSATGSGTFLGANVSDPASQVGTNQGMTLNITQAD